MMLAISIHENQTYGKQPLIFPYFYHLSQVNKVVNLFAQTLEPQNTSDLSIAAWLHDSVEDHPDKINFDVIKQKFGENAANIVKAVTDEKQPSGESFSRKQRAQMLFDRLNAYPNDDALILKLSDRIANISFCVDMEKIGVPNLLDMYAKEQQTFKDNLKPLQRNSDVSNQMWSYMNKLLKIE
jgi:(p)ppGpp synthase/HD superfamily hydrolase